MNPDPQVLDARVDFVPQDPLGFQPSLRLSGLHQGDGYYFVDLLGMMLPAGVDAVGMLRVTSDDGGPVPQIAARTYNVPSAGLGTLGGSLPVLTEDDLIGGGAAGAIPGVSNSADGTAGFRTNLWLINTDEDGPAVVDVALRSESGELVGLIAGHVLAAADQTRVDLFRLLGLDSMTMTGTVVVDVESGGPVGAWVALIDNISQDPTHLPATVVR
jgi:hypothetical protein